jgi:2'-5' RNA ligase
MAYMMNKRYIAIFPQPDPYVQEIRKKYDPLFSTVNPHLTLVFPFENEQSNEDIISHARNLLSNIDLISIQLAEFTIHDNEFIFLNVKQGNDFLISLHDKLYENIFPSHLTRLVTFLPHMTVGRGNNYEFPNILNLLRQDFKIAVEKYDISICEITEKGDRVICSLLSKTT